jgi:hypothetical protein
MGSHYVIQTDLKLAILLPQPPEYWDYRYATPHLVRKYLKKKSFQKVSNYVVISSSHGEEPCSQ